MLEFCPLVCVYVCVIVAAFRGVVLWPLTSVEDWQLNISLWVSVKQNLKKVKSVFRPLRFIYCRVSDHSVLVLLIWLSALAQNQLIQLLFPCIFIFRDKLWQSWFQAQNVLTSASLCNQSLLLHLIFTVMTCQWWAKVQMLHLHHGRCWLAAVMENVRMQQKIQPVNEKCWFRERRRHVSGVCRSSFLLYSVCMSIRGCMVLIQREYHK